LVAGLESRPLVLEGDGDRFAGYVVLGVRFASGDILALRRFPASSGGPAYSSVWHRAPDGRWTLFQDVDVSAGCGKYFSSAVDRAVQVPILIVWKGADRFSVFVAGDEPVAWEVHLRSTPVSRALTCVSSAFPSTLLRKPIAARLLGSAAGALLGAGALTLAGMTPNRFRFLARPRGLWPIASSRAKIGGRRTGEATAGAEDVRLGDFRIPRRGLFAMATATLHPGPEAVAGFPGR
jgi:hypothetical protein